MPTPSNDFRLWRAKALRFRTNAFLAEDAVLAERLRALADACERTAEGLAAPDRPTSRRVYRARWRAWRIARLRRARLATS